MTTIIPRSNRWIALTPLCLFPLAYPVVLLCCFQSGDDNPIKYSTPTSEWEVLETFEPGQIIEIDLAFTNYHWVSKRAGALRWRGVLSKCAVLVD